MDFIKNLKANKRGFSLVELLVVMGIVAVISTIGTTSFLNFKQSKTLDVEIDTVLAEIRGVASRARAQQDGLQWWIHFQNTVGSANDFYLICSGTYTDSGTDCANEGGTMFSRRTLPSGINFVDPPEGVSKDVVFAKATGLPTEYGEIAIKLNDVGKTINVNSNGNIALVDSFVPPPGTVATLDSPTHSNVTETSATLGATIITDGGEAITGRGTCWGTSPDPDTNCLPEGGTGVSSFSHSRIGMSPGTQIYYRGYATNSAGTGYSESSSFTTLVFTPTVAFPTHEDVLPTSATLGATVTEDGGETLTARGTCWGISANPTTNCLAEGGTSEGVFSHSRTNLPADTQIYYRGYATNSIGTTYSVDDTFTTPFQITAPVLDSPTHSGITSSGATLGATITSDGALTITERGTCWGTSPFPTANCNAEGGTSEGAFSHSRIGMSPGTQIYYRGYAINSEGTGYSPDGSFTTLDIPKLSSPTHSSITSSGATLGATVTDNGGETLISRGTCWGTSPDPISNCSPEGGTGESAFTHARSGMPPGTTIYYRGYATNSAGTGYSEDSNFITSFEPPTVTTPTHSGITSSSATLGATVTEDGGTTLTARGTCWGTEAEPTTNCATEGGTAEGSFSHSRTGMPQGTQIYYRGYATNSEGTSYSADETFTTLIDPPTVTTPTHSNIAATSATLGATVAFDGGSALTAKGTCWGTSPDPAINCLATNIGTPIGHWKLDESSGTTASDSSGNGYNGTLVNGPIHATTENCYTGRCLDFDGVDDYVSVPHSATLTNEVFGTSDVFTLSAWANPRSWDDWTTIMNKATGGSWSNTTNGMWASTGGFRCVMGSSVSGNPAGSSIGPSYKPALNDWYHIACVADGTTLKMFVNGSEVGTANISSLTYPRSTNTAPLVFGRRCTGCNPSFNGLIDDIKIYNTNLSDSQIADIYEGGVSTGAFTHTRTGLPQGTQVYYRGYATNAGGTGYSADSSFTTFDVPTVTTPTHSSVTDTSAILGATVTDDGGATLTARGTCWGTSPSPTTNCAAEGGTGVSAFTHSRTGMPQGTTIYYRGYATNSVGTAYSADSSFTTLANPPTVGSPTHANITDTTATLGATVSFNGGSSITARGTCWGTSVDPTTNCLAEGDTATGAFTHARTSLPAGTLIYYRGYATNSQGTGYSTSSSFTTLELPTITSPTHSSVTSSSATLGANVTDNGGETLSARGTCWGTSPNPTGNCAAEGGTGTGAFTHSRTGMPQGTTIYYRGYATNSVGTAYSADSSFTTLKLPTVTSPTHSSITSTTATLGANVTNDGGATITARGTCWSTTDTTPSTNCVSQGTGTGTFTHSRTSLPAGTLIYYRGYATNSVGTAYSAGSSFTTLDTPTVTTTAASSITSVTATLNGTADPNGASTTGWFRYSVTNPGTCNDSFGTRAPLTGGDALGSGTSAVSFNESVTLSPSTTYYFCAIASNSVGTSFGSVLSFTTPTDLVGHWDIDEGSGITVADSSESSNGGTLVNGPTWTTGRYSNALDFGGGNGYVDLANAWAGEPNTFTAWLKIPSTIPDLTRVGNVAGNYNDTNNINWEVHQYGRPRVYWNNGEIDWLITNIDLRTDDWVHYAFVRDKSANKFYFYLNGSLASQRDGVGSDITPATFSRIGGDKRASPGIPFNGTIDDIRVYNRALSASDITALYNAPSNPVVTTPTHSNVTDTTATLGANVTDDGGSTVTDRGTCWGTSPNPTGNCTSQGTGTGTFTHARSGMSAGTTIYYRGYATNSVGTGYSPDGTFTTLELPTVTTPTHSNVTSSSATLGANVTDNGGETLSARGTCWGTSPNPTGNCAAEGGTGTGTFTHGRTSMPIATTIYYRGYATNSVGTAYSADNSFTTQAVLPTIASPTHSSITDTTATLGANVTNDGGVTVTARGTCWSTTDTTPSTNCVSQGTGTGTFTHSRTGLPVGTLIYYRGYADNSVGRAYSTSSNFTTLKLPTITTPTHSLVGITSATLGANVTDDGGATTTRGTCWGTSANPTTNCVEFGEIDDFESGIGSNWSNVTGDTCNWTRDQAGTPSGSTGPTVDHTLGTSSGWYMYVETSSSNCNSGATAIFDGPSFQGGSGSEISFWYHMYGSAMGALNLDVWNGSSWVNGVWSRTGQQQSNQTDPYLQAIVDLSPYSGTIQVRLRYVQTATSFTGDVAIDDIVIPGGDTGVFTQNRTSLPKGTNIFYRGSATNSVGTAYSGDGSFETLDVVEPTHTNVTTSSARLGARVSGTAPGSTVTRGTCWGTSPDPTLATGDCESEGTGTGTFTHDRTGLPAATTVYYTGYITDTTGTIYTEDRSFVTVGI